MSYSINPFANNLNAASLVTDPAAPSADVGSPILVPDGSGDFEPNPEHPVVQQLTDLQADVNLLQSESSDYVKFNPSGAQTVNENLILNGTLRLNAGRVFAPTNDEVFFAGANNGKCKLTNVANPVDDFDGMNLKYFDNNGVKYDTGAPQLIKNNVRLTDKLVFEKQDGTVRGRIGSTAVNSIQVENELGNSILIKNVADPVDLLDAVNKQYLDNAVAGVGGGGSIDTSDFVVKSGNTEQYINPRVVFDKHIELNHTSTASQGENIIIGPHIGKLRTLSFQRNSGGDTIILANIKDPMLSDEATTKFYVDNQSSDIRLKEDIKEIECDGRFDKLRPVNFNWKDSEIEHINKNCNGFIADEIEELYPELCSVNKEGYKGVQYIQIIAMLVKEVQELKKRVASN